MEFYHFTTQRWLGNFKQYVAFSLVGVEKKRVSEYYTVEILLIDEKRENKSPWTKYYADTRNSQYCAFLCTQF